MIENVTRLDKKLKAKMISFILIDKVYKNDEQDLEFKGNFESG